MKRIILFLLPAFLFISSYSQTQYSKVVFETTAGNMVFMLYDETPFHSENFTKLINEGYYNNQLFHRVMKNFMIQSGDPDSKTAKPGKALGHGGPGYTIPAEFVPEYYHKKGALAAARQGDRTNPKKESSGSQFYIVKGKTYTESELLAAEKHGSHILFTAQQKEVYTTIGGTPHLDYSYTVFGELTEGMDVLDLISTSATDKRDRPLNDIRILKAYTIK